MALEREELSFEDEASIRSNLERTVVCCCSADLENSSLLSEFDENDLRDWMAAAAYRAASEILKEGGEPNLFTVMHRLQVNGHPDAAKTFYSHMAGENCDRQPFSVARQIVEDLKLVIFKHKVQIFAWNVAALSKDHEKKIGELQAALPKMLVELLTSRKESDITTEGKAAGVLAFEIEEEEDRKRKGLASLKRALGYPKVDTSLGLMAKDEFVVVAAPSSHGKSSMGLQIGRFWAGSGPCYFWSGEMSRLEIARRAACQHYGIEKEALTSVLLWEFEQKHAVPLHIDDDASLTPEQLIQRVRLFKHRHPTLTGLIVDSIPLLAKGAIGQRRDLVVGACTKALKLAAAELKVPVLAMHQMSQDFKSRPDKTPLLTDLGESKQVGDDANRVLMLHRPAKYDSSYRYNRIQAWCRKNRDGVADVCFDFDFEASRFRFVEAEPPAPKPTAPAAPKRELRDDHPRYESRYEPSALLQDIDMEDIEF